MTTFDECVSDARSTLDEQIEYNREFLAGMSQSRIEDWLQEQMHEVVDGAVPIYNAEIMAVAADSRVWTQDTEDLGTPRDLMQAAQWAIYQAIEEALVGELSSIAERIVDEYDEAQEAEANVRVVGEAVTFNGAPGTITHVYSRDRAASPDGARDLAEVRLASGTVIVEVAALVPVSDE